MKAEIAGQPIELRAFEPGDLNFILATWMRSERDAMCFHWKLQKYRTPSIYWAATHASFVIASSPEVRSTIYGWICYNEEPARKVPHWAYVVRDLRGNGLLRIMAKELGL